MKRSVLTVILLIGLVTVLASGCVYTKVQRPQDKNYEKTELGSKEGRSQLQSILWIIAWGDGGTKAAAENGNIKVIKHADTETLVVLFGLYTRLTTVVYGD
jgi:hypothetical protein